jgi:hypothetical protein
MSRAAMQGGSNMTGTDLCGLFTHKSVPVILESPCIILKWISYRLNEGVEAALNWLNEAVEAALNWLLIRPSRDLIVTAMNGRLLLRTNDSSMSWTTISFSCTQVDISRGILDTVFLQRRSDSASWHLSNWTRCSSNAGQTAPGDTCPISVTREP